MTSGWTHVSKMTFAPQIPFVGNNAGKSNMDGAEITAQGIPSRFPVALHLGAKDHFRRKLCDVLFHLKVIISDQRYPKLLESPRKGRAISRL